VIVQLQAADGAGLAGNPFSTRHTRPGRIIALDGYGRPRDIEALLCLLAARGGRAAIRGPHGSGKTTLLEHLARRLAADGATVARVRLRSWRDAPLSALRDIAVALGAILRCPAGGTVCIDSWEQLGRTGAVIAKLLASLRRCGLLVTTHRDTCLPLLAAGDTTPALLAAIVRMLPGSDNWIGAVVAPADIEDAFEKSAGNIREALYELYDRFEERTKAGSLEATRRQVDGL